MKNRMWGGVGMWKPSQDMGWGRDVETKSGYGVG